MNDAIPLTYTTIPRILCATYSRWDALLLRARTGRPHWIVLDEAHHMLPESWGHVLSVLPHKLGAAILVTAHPDHVAPAVLAPIDLVLAVGEEPDRTMKKFAGEQPPFTVEPQPCRAERIRHHRKYVEGNLRYHSFYFRGPEGRLNLRAQNLWMFCQIAEGLDERTWMFHLLRADLPWLQSRHLIRELVSARCTLPE